MIKSRYTACFLLHALGDTIGFKNGEWEFNYYREQILPTISNEILYDFIHLGGINHICLKDWKISDDTILHLKTAEAFSEEKITNVNMLGEIITKKYIEAYDQLKKEAKIRIPGKASMKYLERLKETNNWNSAPYDLYAGGSGASMRCSCIGLIYHGKENRHKLIQISIEVSRILHNSAVGYLGGMTSALFTSFAIENIDMKKWPFMLLDLFKNIIPKIIKSSGRDLDKYETDSHVFIEKWNKYISDKFDSNGKVIIRRSSKNIVLRSQYYINNFSFSKETLPGSGGDDSVIISYDCLLDSGNNWEKLVIYSMLHVGDTDTTGCIAGSWFGALYGLDNVPTNNLKYLEMKNEIINISEKIYELYN
jgi:ADP-ribosylglycohydrolase